MMLEPRDFLSLDDLEASEFDGLFRRAAQMKLEREQGETVHTLKGRVLGMIFEKASTRTRVSFEVAMFDLGGHAVHLPSEASQMARGEAIADTARVLAGYCHGILIRTFAQARAAELARYSSVPVLNGLTDLRHPCQIVSDLFTVYESLGDVRDVRFAWVGDGNNMANSWITAAGILGLDLRLACPPGYEPDREILQRAEARIAEHGRGRLQLLIDAASAVQGADVVSTDVWASMGQEDQAAARARAFAGYRVDHDLLANAAPDVLVLHCLPAHRGEEISADIIDGPQSVVWRQAENRLHTQKALLEVFLG